MRRALCSTVAFILVFGLGGDLVRAQHAPPPTPTGQAPNLNRIGVDERLERMMDLDIPFRNHRGEEVRLADYFDGERPVLLNFAYFDCPVLCGLVMNATINRTKEIGWTAGTEYDIVTISIDPNDTPAAASRKRQQVLERYDREVGEGGWHFLTGDQDAIDAATEAAGFRYFYQQREDEYAHAAVIMFLTPDGKFARYLYGIDFAASDVRMALLEASEGRSITTLEQVLIYCYQYRGAQEGYGLVATRVMQLGGLLTVLILGGFLFILWRRELIRRPKQAESKGSPLNTSEPQVEAS